MKLARRLAQISVSPTLAVLQEAGRLRKEGVDVIDFGPGEPDFPTPDFVKEAAQQAIRENFTKYTVVAGIDELREAVAERYNRGFGSRFAAENVIICAGAKHGLYDVAMVLWEEGDQVLIPAPYWVTFPEIVKLADAQPVSVPTRPEKGFVLEAGDLQPFLGPRVSGLIVNSPCNPSGAVVPDRNLAEILDVCRRNGIHVVSDETYDRFTYEGHPHASLASFVDPVEEDWAIVGSFSKTYSMTGWRIGYVITNVRHAREVNSFQSHQSGNSCSISQKAALAALQGDQKVVDEMLEEYARRRRFILDELNRTPGFSCPAPYGAFYAFPNIEEGLRMLGLKDSVEFARFLVSEARVTLVPGSAFGMEGYLRFSYATSMENLRRGMSRIQDAVRRRVTETVGN